MPLSSYTHILDMIFQSEFVSHTVSVEYITRAINWFLVISIVLEID